MIRHFSSRYLFLPHLVLTCVSVREEKRFSLSFSEADFDGGVLPLLNVSFSTDMHN